MYFLKSGLLADRVWHSRFSTAAVLTFKIPMLHSFPTCYIKMLYSFSLQGCSIRALTDCMPSVWLMFSFIYNTVLHTHSNYYLLQNKYGKVIILPNIGLTLIFKLWKSMENKSGRGLMKWKMQNHGINDLLENNLCVCVFLTSYKKI